MDHLSCKKPGEDPDVRRLRQHVLKLEQRLSALEAELVPASRSRKCPRCHQLGLEMVKVRPHPEFGSEGIQQHELRCGHCRHKHVRLYDPNEYIC